LNYKELFLMTQKEKKKLIIICGPTASGKTELAIKLAREIGGILINADSVQVYKGLDIGSAKGDIRRIGDMNCAGSRLPLFDIENSGIVSVMFDLVNPDEEFNVYMYQAMVRNIIDLIYEGGFAPYTKSRIPILVGGTGLYVDSIYKNYGLQKISANFSLRNQLENLGIGQLQDALLAHDSVVFANLNNSDKNNPRRLIRLIEKSKSKSIETYPSSLNRYNSLVLYPIFEKDELLKKIDKRVLKMIDDGFVGEVEALLRLGYSRNLKVLQSTGYKQIIQYINGGYKDIAECIESIQLAHRQYAKRQITWFEGSGRGYQLQKVNIQTIVWAASRFIS
jgi:tRNA dimethylallyltransferase